MDATMLNDASVELVEAIARGDLDAATQALDKRTQAIASGAIPNEAIVALGEHACAMLQGLKRQASFDSARLRQIQQTFSDDPPNPQVESHL